MKKICYIVIFIVSISIFSHLSTNVVYAEEITQGNFTFEIEFDYAVITGVADEASLGENLKIPDKFVWGGIFPVKVIGANAFSFLTDIKSVTMPDTITTIRPCAFLGCYNLESVSFSNKLCSIYGQAFEDCYKLKNINLPETVVSIGDSNITDPGYGYTFKNCTSLTEIVVPSGLTNIRKGLFEGCENLEKVVLPDTIESIEEDAFAFCYNLSNINYPKNLTSVGYGIFTNSKFLDDKWHEYGAYWGDSLVAVSMILDNSGMVNVKDGTKIICDQAFMSRCFCTFYIIFL